MTDEQLIGYALNGLPPHETHDVERELVANPAAVAQLAKLKKLLGVLAHDSAEPLPPTGLATTTIAAVAAHVVQHRIPVAAAECDSTPCRTHAPVVEPTKQRSPLLSSRFAELAIAASIAFLVMGLVVTGILKMRADNQAAMCQNTLRELHASLSGYAETHHDRFPQVGSLRVPTASAFVPELIAAGYWSPDRAVLCAAEGTKPIDDQTTYAYSLGYRDGNGFVVGLKRAEGVSDTTPIVADRPTRVGLPMAHATGQNILYVGGGVRFAKTVTVGPSGDDIYCNDNGLARAGLHPLDASLGRAHDVP